MENPNLYAGDRFEAIKLSEVAGVKYELNAKSDEVIISSLPKGKSTINLYYDGVQDFRKDASILVNRIYKTGKFVLNQVTGRYEEVYDTKDPIEYQKVEKLKTHTTYNTSTTIEVTEGYTYDSTDKGVYNSETNEVSLKLAEGKNELNLTFKKPADKSGMKPVDVIVKHQYYLTEKKIEDGKLVTIVPEEPIIVEEEHKDFYRGEFFTPEEKKTYNELEYVSDSSNAGKIKPHELMSDVNTYVITLTYRQTVAPPPATVNVNHIYRTFEKVYVPTYDEEGIETGGTIETIENEVGRVTETIESINSGTDKELLYEGYKFPVTKNGQYEGEGYNFNLKDSLFNEEPFSDPDDGVLLQKDVNTLDLYYDIHSDERDDAAQLEVKHTYQTKLTTVENGKIITKIVSEIGGNTDKSPEDAKVGDIYTITPQNMYNDIEYPTIVTEFPSEVQLKKGTNETITILYEREDSDLKATALKVVHKYIKKVMTVINGVAGYYESGTTEESVNDFTVNGGITVTDGGIYVGEIYEIDLVDTYKDEVYSASTSNPGISIELAGGDNFREYVYTKETALPKTRVTVKHNYSHTTIDSMGNSDTSISTDTVEMPQPYVGETVTTSAVLAGFAFKDVTVEGAEAYEIKAENAVALTTSNVAVVVNYNYTKTTNNSVGASYVINHHYRTLDWNDSADKEYTLDSDINESGNGYATQTITGVPNLKLDDAGTATFELDRAEGTSEFTDGYTMTLAEGPNEINFYYTQKVDTRTGTVVKVVHNYYKHDLSGMVPDAVIGETSDSAITTLPGVLAGTYEEVFTGKGEGAWVGKNFEAKKRNVHGVGEDELTYEFKDANPENCTIEFLELKDKENPNLIAINYVYNYDASANVTVKINHTYRTHDTYTDERTEETDTVIAQYGNDQFGSWNKADKEFTAKSIDKTGFARQTSNEDMSITYNVGKNEMTVIYTRTVSSRPGGGGNNGGGGGNTGTDDGTDIGDEDVPLTDGPIDIGDEGVPKGDMPNKEEDKIILEEEVPLAGLPKTGGVGMAGFLGIGTALLALGAFMRKKEKQN